MPRVPEPELEAVPGQELEPEPGLEIPFWAEETTRQVERDDDGDDDVRRAWREALPPEELLQEQTVISE